MGITTGSRDKNLTKVSKYWESRYKILEDSLTLHQKYTPTENLMGRNNPVSPVYQLVGVSSLTGMVWAVFTTFYDTILYI